MTKVHHSVPLTVDFCDPAMSTTDGDLNSMNVLPHGPSEVREKLLLGHWTGLFWPILYTRSDKDRQGHCWVRREECVEPTPQPCAWEAGDVPVSCTPYTPAGITMSLMVIFRVQSQSRVLPCVCTCHLLLCGGRVPESEHPLASSGLVWCCVSGESEPCSVPLMTPVRVCKRSWDSQVLL